MFTYFQSGSCEVVRAPQTEVAASGKIAQAIDTHAIERFALLIGDALIENLEANNLLARRSMPHALLVIGARVDAGNGAARRNGDLAVLGGFGNKNPGIVVGGIRGPQRIRRAVGRGGSLWRVEYGETVAHLFAMSDQGRGHTGHRVCIGRADD